MAYEKEEEIEFDKDEEDNIGIAFSSKEGLSKDDIVMEAWRDCRIKRAVEMRKGFYNTKFDKQGNAFKIWIPDTREIYINSVKAFEITLQGDIDDEYKLEKEKLCQEEEKAFKKYGWRIFKVTKEKIPNSLYDIYKKQYTGETVMPEAEEGTVYDINSDGKQFSIDWRNQYHQYMQSLVLIYDKIFKEIVILLKRLKYFKKKQKFG